MKFCPGCGKKSDKNDLTCSRCGIDFTKVRDTIDDDGNRIPTGDTIEEGKVLNNRYKIKSLLGRGGMGRVYRAYDMQLDEDVALKMLEAGESSEVITTRFLREIKIARKITHENICRIYDLVEAEGKKFISMQFIDGDDLQTILKREGAVDFKKALRILNDILDALGAIHAKGIIHRDLKPANIILSARGKAYITDFGIAKGKDDGKDLRLCCNGF